MYLVLLCSLSMFITFATANPHGHWRHHHNCNHTHHEWGHHHYNWSHNHHPNCFHNLDDNKPNSFEDFAGEIISFDRRAQTWCNSQYVIEENYIRDGYELKGKFKEFSQEDFTIKIKHRAINIVAEKGELKYITLIILPKVANTKQATWSFFNTELRILFPYTYFQQNEIQNSCNIVIDESVITVPKVDPAVTPGFDFRDDE